ncbi:MAG: tRNA (adenosine(37)-N6)-threonylcarbamoyltransferase complex dimerization subunit type 1 TsaB [Ideonella sp.]|nr:tRNA (adenosine(37)-N6)-threonylcarbamoyltransferase complex dimerization subunit type 1 TsaB [Ideonella sp.]
MPVLLVFDTSGERLSAGLVTDHGRWLHEGPGGARASAGLVPALGQLVAEAGCTFRDLDAVGFGQGPGAFTGLRTACAVAQGLAEAVGRPVLPLDTLEAVALDAWRRAGAAQPARVWAVQDARMDEIYAGAYEVEAGGRSRPIQVPDLWTADSLSAVWSAPPASQASARWPMLIGGTAVAVCGERLRCATARFDPDAWPSPDALLDLALQRHAAGAARPAAAARPAYVRDRVALTTAEREARAAAQGPAR